MSLKNSDSESEFPGLYGSEISYKTDSDYGDSGGELSKKELLRSRKKEKNKDKGYAALDGDSSTEDMDNSETNSRTSSKSKKAKSFKFLQKKEEKDKEDKKDDKRRKEKKKEEKKREKEEKRKLKKDKKKRADGHGDEMQPVFGVPLSIAIQRNPSHDGINLPAIVRQCIDTIEERGLECEDIYKMGGYKSKANAIRREIDQGGEVSLRKHHPHVIAALLKQFLKELPEPILTREMMPHFEDVSLIPNPLSRAISLRQLVNRLPTPNKLLVQYMLSHMVNIVRKEKENRMSVQNLCIILSPVTQISHRVLNVMLLSQEQLLKDVEIQRYIAPYNGLNEDRSLDDLTTAEELAEEIARQESLLAFLHSAVSSSNVSSQRAEQLWEAQRIVTLLKRKLKSAKVKDTDNSTEPSQADSASHNSSEESTKDAPEQIEQEQKQQSEPTDDAKESKAQQKTSEIPMLPKPASAKATRAMSQEDSKVEVKTVESKGQSDSSKLQQTESSFVQNQNSFEKDKWMERILPSKNRELTINDDIEVIKEELLKNQLFHEELLAMNHNLTKRLQKERQDALRLKEQIREMQTLYAYRTHSYDSSESDGSESADESDTEEEIFSQMKYYQRVQNNLKAGNRFITDKIQSEREKIIELRVALRHAKS